MKTNRRAQAARWTSIVFLLAVLVALAVGLVCGWRDQASFRQMGTSQATWVFRIQRLSALFALVPLASALLRRLCLGRQFLAQVRTFFPVRLLVWVLLATLVTTTAAVQFNLFEETRLLIRSFFNSALLVFLGLWALLVVWLPGLYRRPLRGLAAFVDAAVFNIVVIGLLLEGALGLWAGFSHSPVFWDASRIEATVRQQRLRPHSTFFNFPVNSKGYHDTEFQPGRPNALTVAVLADSFGVGIVPYDYNYVTVAERCLAEALAGRYRRVSLDNYGIGGIGMREYYHLLTREVLPTRPSLVLLCVFVGNDIFGYPGRWMGRYGLQGWWIWILPQRLLRLESSKREGGQFHVIGESTGDTNGIPDYLQDTSREPPTATPRRFMEIEARRIEICNPGNRTTQQSYQEFFRNLGRFRRILGDKLLVLIIPDEFQVNDDLYEVVRAMKPTPGAYHRDFPQERITLYCRKQHIPVLDLLPLLRSAQKQDRTYHLRDTHWNARGNFVAGQAVCRFIREHVDREEGEVIGDDNLPPSH